MRTTRTWEEIERRVQADRRECVEALLVERDPIEIHRLQARVEALDWVVRLRGIDLPPDQSPADTSYR